MRRGSLCAPAIISRTTEGIRLVRQTILRLPEQHAARRIALLRADFYSTDGCRALLFVAIRLNPLGFGNLAHSLEQAGLAAVGFDADRRFTSRYAKRFPLDVAMTDFANWHNVGAAETDHGGAELFALGAEASSRHRHAVTLARLMPLLSQTRRHCPETAQAEGVEMSERILVVDDDPVQRRLIENMVRKFGYEAIVAEGGDQAARILNGDAAARDRLRHPRSGDARSRRPRPARAHA